MSPSLRSPFRAVDWTYVLRLVSGIFLVLIGAARFVSALASVESKSFIVFGLLEALIGVLLLLDLAQDQRC